MKRIILIGGAPTAGKSTLAKHVASYFGLPWISTDQIRDIMRSVAREEDYPKLFNGEKSAEEFHKKYSPEEVVLIEVEQSKAVWLGIKKFIQKDYTWTDGFVVEGVNILPELVSDDFGDVEEVSALFVVDNDKERIRKVIFERGLWDDAEKYSDEVKEKEVEWVSLFGEWIEQQAKQFTYPVVQVQKDESDLESVLKMLE